MKPKWYERSMRRNLLDFHIDDWHPAFLSKLDPAHFAECVAALKSTAATVFANTHTGLCTYPTKVGEMHAGLKGRDALGELIGELHKRGIDVVVYYVMIFADWYWDNHPEARVVDADGQAIKVLIGSKGKPRRFSTTCPNNPEYRRFVVAQIQEICDGYEFEGVWPDMTFWPTVCYCASCRERYRKEIGGEIPRVIDWEDPAWVGFQRKRQEWMVEFGQLVTDTFKRKKPHLSVAHQSLAFHADWSVGGSLELAGVTDWLSADLYGERYGLSFFAKLFYALSGIKPFEHINTWCWPDIHEHVITRTEDHLRLTALSAMANHGAMVFIDAIDPIGTVHARSFATGGKVYADIERYEKEVGGRFCQDVGVYYSYESNVDLKENGRGVAEAGYTFVDTWKHAKNPTAHRNAAINLAKTLIQHHIPFGALSRKDLGRLSEWQVICLPNVALMSAEEAEALRAYVRGGGSILATGKTSLITAEGRRQPTFQLADLFGCDYAGETREVVTYAAPSGKRDELFPGFFPTFPVTLYDTQLKVSVRAGAEVIATLTLPFTDPTESRYASILTDAPGIPTDYPSIVINRFGKGQVVYAAGVIESWEHDSQRQVLANLIRLLATRPFSVECDAPKPVEITLFEQKDRKRYVANVINYQQELPNIPIHDLKLSIRMDGRAPKAARILPEGPALPLARDGDRAVVTIPVLKDFAMVEVSWG
jgi:hypothetical protein